MLEIAHEKGCYSALYAAEAVTFLAHTDEAPFHLIVAADVLPYVGDAVPLLSSTAARLLSGGLIAFSTEIPPPGVVFADGYGVGPNQRFAHEPDYLRRCLSETGFGLTHAEPITVRHESGKPVVGELIIAQL
ncbi:MAG: S-adenosylmethionine-dependent methyltransferase, partial [Pseudomonadota bacterium]